MIVHRSFPLTFGRAVWSSRSSVRQNRPNSIENHSKITRKSVENQSKISRKSENAVETRKSLERQSKYAPNKTADPADRSAATAPGMAYCMSDLFVCPPPCCDASHSLLSELRWLFGTTAVQPPSVATCEVNNFYYKILRF